MANQRTRARQARRRGRRDNGRMPADRQRMSMSNFVAKRPVVHRFTRCTSITATTAAAADQGFNFTFTLADVLNPTEFTALFDQYRITACEVTLYAIPIVNTTVGDRLYPYAHYAPDWDGPNTAPTSADDLLQREDVHFHVFTPEKPTLTMRVNRPGVLATINDLVPTQASALNLRSPWLDCGDSNIEHFGIPLFLSNFNTGTGDAVLIRYFKRYWLEMRQTR